MNRLPPTPPQGETGSNIAPETPKGQETNPNSGNVNNDRKRAKDRKRRQRELFPQENSNRQTTLEERIAIASGSQSTKPELKL